MGCPAGGPDALEPVSDDDDDEEQETKVNGDHTTEEDEAG